ncbi:hypothetical protein ABT354_03855 [Streptomyces sp. NPDC000594]|uniref:hypothetical protein n=1 Tax=Streptomyces sp. NPDC000594 TaxID=3154261 RepID=UPI00332544D8
MNNFLHLAPWVLGFGPGPFFGKEASGVFTLFPGGFSARGDYGLEGLKLGVEALLALALAHGGARARKHRSFSR